MSKFKEIKKLDSFLAKTFLILYVSVTYSYGGTEFCNKEGEDAVYWLNSTNCPYGILFPEPVYVDCFICTDVDAKDTFADICKGTPIDSSDSPIQIQYIPNTGDNQVALDQTCNAEDKCGLKGYMDADWVNRALANPPILERKYAPWPDATSGMENDAAVGNQTLRLFKHLMGLTDNDNAPNMRIITLLRKSFQILGKFCKAPYVPMEFSEDVLAAFLFILAESDTSTIIDVPLEDYRRIDKALNDCMDQKNPFKFIGQSCRINPQIDQINTTDGKVITYETNEFSWKADKHDIPIDATWGTMDFVHGLCYGTFKDHVNSHHLFEQAIERVFTHEIVYRWERPILLARQEMYDNFFSANVRTTIYNLEYCIQAAYQDAPFLHRLERMLLKFTPPASLRKKRSIFPIKRFDKLDFYCFDELEPRDEMVEKFKKMRC